MKEQVVIGALMVLGGSLFGACTEAAEGNGDPALEAGAGGDGSGGSGVGLGGGAGTGLGLGGTGVTGVGGAASTGGTSGLGGAAAAGGTEEPGAAGGEAGAPAEPTEPTVLPPTNPYVIVQHDPLSTFAVDVDTASYDAFRRDALAGGVPLPVTVRLEEFVNYFDYDYPAPAEDSEEPFSINLAAATNPFQAGTTMFRVGIQGEKASGDKPPTNLVFLVDTSGSMASAEKLPLVKQLLSESLSVLDGTDKVSIVTYAGSTEVRLAPTNAAETTTIRGVIETLESGGSTAGAAGIDLAYQQAESAFIEGGLNHVILCTDGDFNVGPSSTAELVELIETKRESGVTLTVLGFGFGNNDDLMEEVSNAGNGIYGSMVDSLHVSRYVEDRLLSTLVHIAKDVKIQVEFNPEFVAAYRLLGYENRAIADDDFRNDVIDAGEIGSGHRVTALYELVLSGDDVPMPEGARMVEEGAIYSGSVEAGINDLALVKVRYKLPGASSSDAAMEVNQAFSAGAALGVVTELDADFRWAVAVAGLAEVLKQSPFATAEHDAILRELLEADPQTTRDRADLVELMGNVTLP